MACRVGMCSDTIINLIELQFLRFLVKSTDSFYKVKVVYNKRIPVRYSFIVNHF